MDPQQNAERKARKTPHTCSTSINEPCPFHPVDCPRCVNRDMCQMRETMQAHPDKIKRCKFYRRRPHPWTNKGS